MISALSPLDGRYSEALAPLARIFSERGLIQTRISVEVEWLIYLCNELELKGTDRLGKSEVAALRKLYIKFQDSFAEQIKEIESTTRHDVKAVEYFLQTALKALKRSDLIPFIHFACTSEDINNLAYGIMLREAVGKIMLPNLEKILLELKNLAEKYSDLPMMARTHGQPASPTTVGKEFKNVGARLFRQIEALKKQEYFGKINGATGNFNAHVVAYPEVNWPKASKEFVEFLRLKWQRYTTQIEPHDYLAEIFDQFRRINVILLDLDRDLWTYISQGVFKQKLAKGEVGSSTMPHKVNPIDFENSEGNLGIANALFSHFSEKLPISRLQRDLSDSTVLRNLGVAFGHSFLAYNSTLKGLSKIEADEKHLEKELDEHWELLAEAIQTVMRAHGITDAYEQLKELTRGEKVRAKEVESFVEGLKIPAEAKKRLLKLSPSTYIGLAKDL